MANRTDNKYVSGSTPLLRAFLKRGWSSPGVVDTPADRVPQLMADLFGWLAATDAHPLIASSVFHYEFEFIHPFSDGNGRMGWLWQSLILARWNPLFADIPVESLIFEHQAEYYQAIQESTQKTDSAPFVAFIAYSGPS